MTHPPHAGHTLKMEPLASVKALLSVLQRKVTKQWYDAERSELAFVKKLKAGYQVGNGEQTKSLSVCLSVSVCVVCVFSQLLLSHSLSLSLSQLNTTPHQPVFTYSHDFDENGIFYWVGTNGRTATEWANPARYSLVVVTTSEGRQVRFKEQI